MKIEQQKPAFEPIVVTLETEEEVAALWDIVEERLRGQHIGELTPIRDLCIKINNYFRDRKQSLLS